MRLPLTPSTPSLAITRPLNPSRNTEAQNQHKSWSGWKTGLSDTLTSSMKSLATATATATTTAAKNLFNRTAAIATTTVYVLSQIPGVESSTAAIAETLTGENITETVTEHAVNCTRWLMRNPFFTSACDVEKQSPIYTSCCPNPPPDPDPTPNPNTLKVVLPFVFTVFTVGSVLLYKSGIIQKDNKPPLQPLSEDESKKLMTILKADNLLSTDNPRELSTDNPSGLSDFTAKDCKTMKLALMTISLKAHDPDQFKTVENIKNYFENPNSKHSYSAEYKKLELPSEDIHKIIDHALDARKNHDENALLVASSGNDQNDPLVVSADDIEMQKLPSLPHQSRHKFLADDTDETTSKTPCLPCLTRRHNQMK